LKGKSNLFDADIEVKSIKVNYVTLLIIMDFAEWFNEAQTFSKTMPKRILFVFAAQQKGNILA
jgi:hypothetical protein